MSFNGTRQNGRSTPNRSNSKIKQAFTDLIESNLDKLKADLNGLEGKDRLRFIIDLASYVLPKMKAIEVTNESESNVNPIIVEIVSKEDIKGIINDLENKY
jgi:hypothetical protein